MSSTSQSTSEKLPDVATWRKAIGRAAVLFDETFESEATAAGMDALGRAARSGAGVLVDDAGRLVDTLTRAYTTWNRRAGQGSQRLATAIASRDLVVELATADDHRVVRLLVGYRPPSSIEACARSLATAPAVIEALEATDLVLWDTARSVVGYQVNRMLDDNEINLPLVAAATEIERLARDGRPTSGGVDEQEAADDPTGTGATSAPGEPGPGQRTVGAISRKVRSVAELDALRDDLDDALATGELLITWQHVSGS